MKTKVVKVITLIIGMILISSSCTIQKRKYLKGYYVSWNKNFNSKHQAPKTTQLNVNKNIKKINLTTPATGIDMPKKVEIKTLTKKKITSNHLKNKNVKKSTKSTLKNKINPNKIETKQKYITNVVTDSTTTKYNTNNKLKDETKPINNKTAIIALALFVFSLIFFLFGGAITIIISYFMAILAFNQINDNPGVYLKRDRIKAIVVIILFNVFALAFSILIGIIFGFFSYIFYAVAFVYGLCAIIGLIILRNKSLERTNKNTLNKYDKSDKNTEKTEPNQDENNTSKTKRNNKRSYKQLAIFLLVSLLSFGLYFLIE